MSTVPTALRRAAELVDLGRAPQAIDLLLRLLREHPEHAGAIERQLAHAHLAANRPGQAHHHARRAVAAEPHASGGHLILGMALHRQGRPQDALDPLHTAARLEPDAAEPWQALAQSLSDLDRHQDAYAAANEALRRAPEAASSHFAMGYALHDTHPVEASRAYRKVLELNPGHVVAKHNLAGISVLGGDWERGSQGLADVLAASPSARSPLFVLDQRLVIVVRRLHWLVFAGIVLYMAGSQAPRGVGFAVVLALVGAAAPVVAKGTGPIRRALPGGGGHYFRGFPGREPIAAAWLVCVTASWLWLVVVTVLNLGDPARVAGVFAFLPLVIGVVLSWVRVPLAHRRARQVRYERT